MGLIPYPGRGLDSRHQSPGMKFFHRTCYAPERMGQCMDVTARCRASQTPTKQQQPKEPNHMKTNNTIRTLIVASAALITASNSQAANRTFVLLQENSSGTSYMTDVLPAGPTRDAADALIDTFVEIGETANLQGITSGSYQRFVNLSDTNCTRAKLLAELIKQSREGYTVDLAVLGHGSNESLLLHNGEKLTGRTTQTITNPFTGLSSTLISPGSIRTLLTDARAQQGTGFNFKLRVVHMCNCFGGTTNDDWLAIGAKASVGAPLNNYMAEPMISTFWRDFVKNDKRVKQAADDSRALAAIAWSVVPSYGPFITETQQLTSGDGNIIFTDEYQLALNQSRTITVNANATHTFPLVYLVAGQKYAFTAATNDTWGNGFSPFTITSNANGYTPGPFDVLRRNGAANMMALVGERFTHPNPLNLVGGSGFSIGTSKAVTAPGHGFLHLFANDIITGYGDNSGSISVTVKRTL